MTLFKNKYRIESSRLPGYDYSSPGLYFVTICTRDRCCFFGDVLKAEMDLSPIDEIVADEWQKTPQIRTNVQLDEWIVMPNHVHGIIWITHTARTTQRETTQRVVSYGGAFPGEYLGFDPRTDQVGLYQTNTRGGVCGFRLARTVLR